MRIPQTLLPNFAKDLDPSLSPPWSQATDDIHKVAFDQVQPSLEPRMTAFHSACRSNAKVTMLIDVAVAEAIFKRLECGEVVKCRLERTVAKALLKPLSSLCKSTLCLRLDHPVPPRVDKDPVVGC